MLGTEIVRRLEARGATVTSASRRTGVDLATGKGLEAAFHAADCVVHAATHRLRHRRVDLDGTRRIIKILASRSTPPHLIYVSIVGCDHSPLRYYRAKYASEMVLERSQLPVTVVRASSFTHWWRQLLGLQHPDQSHSYLGACHSSHATIAGSPPSSPTSHSARHRQAMTALLIGPGPSASASPTRWN